MCDAEDNRKVCNDVKLKISVIHGLQVLLAGLQQQRVLQKRKNLLTECGCG
jgi:hypothetical protein